MKRAITTAALATLVAAAPASAIPLPPGPPPPPPPTITQLVVFRDGSFREKAVRTRRVAVHIGRRRCIVAPATPLGALVASRVAKIALRDFGHCSRRPRDAAGLFVRKLGPDANRGQDGWVYKAGHKTGSAGAADPSGPFGHGKLKNGAHVLWFYCHMQGSSCQRTLSFDEIDTQPPGGLVVHVGAYDDRGKEIPAAGVTVHVDAVTAITDASGIAHLTAAVGQHTMYADGGGYVRSFDTPVELQ